MGKDNDCITISGILSAMNMASGKVKGAKTPKNPQVFYAGLPEGRFANPVVLGMTCPMYNPNRTGVTVSSAYVYNTTGYATDVLEHITISNVSPFKFDILLDYDASYAGKMLGITFNDT